MTLPQQPFILEARAIPLPAIFRIQDATYRCFLSGNVFPIFYEAVKKKGAL